MFGFGKAKMVEQVMGYSITVLAPTWTPMLGSLNGYLAHGIALAAAEGLRGVTEEKARKKGKDTSLDASVLEGFVADLTERLPGQLPPNADPAVLASLAVPDAESFDADYPLGSHTRELVDAALRSYVDSPTGG